MVEGCAHRHIGNIIVEQSSGVWSSRKVTLGVSACLSFKAAMHIIEPVNGTQKGFGLIPQAWMMLFKVCVHALTSHCSQTEPCDLDLHDLL